MSNDLDNQLDGLVQELGASRVRKLAKAVGKGLSGDVKGPDAPIIRTLVAQYGADQVASAFAKMQATLDSDEHLRTVRRDAQKVGRNDPCPCGSGKKHKKCCG